MLLKKLKYSAFITVTIIMAGCASVGVTEVKPGLAKEESCELDVYSSETEIKKEYEVACILDAKTGSGMFDDKTVAGALKLVKPRACKCGADAVVLMNSARQGVTAFGWGEGQATVKAIKYK